LGAVPQKEEVDHGSRSQFLLAFPASVVLVGVAAAQVFVPIVRALSSIERFGFLVARATKIAERTGFPTECPFRGRCVSVFPGVPYYASETANWRRSVARALSGFHSCLSGVLIDSSLPHSWTVSWSVISSSVVCEDCSSAVS
jgi:hypothetical protein